MAAQPGGRQRLQDHGHDLRVALGRGRPDQLEPRLEELARLRGAAFDRAVRVREVEEPQRQRRVGEAVRHQARGRDRAVGAQHQHPALVVEQPEGGSGGPVVAAPQHVLVLERGGLDLAVAVLLEHAAQAVREQAQLARLVGQNIARTRGKRMDHAGNPSERRTTG